MVVILLKCHRDGEEEGDRDEWGQKGEYSLTPAKPKIFLMTHKRTEGNAGYRFSGSVQLVLGQDLSRPETSQSVSDTHLSLPSPELGLQVYTSRSSF